MQVASLSPLNPVHKPMHIPIVPRHVLASVLLGFIAAAFDITDGKLDIKFTPDLENPEINGIEIIPRT
jgi:hypothetical protein